MSRPVSQACHPLHQLYSDHHGWLNGWLNRRMGNHGDAADLAQDTFVRLLLAPGDNLQSIPAPRPYLATIAKRLMLNLYRRRTLEQAYLDALMHLPAEQTPTLERQALILEALHEVDAVLSRLPFKARKAFLLYQIEGCDQQTIAATLDVSVRTVQRYLSIAFEECIVLAAEGLTLP
jgi:RNA polymerase sigma-70 factor (ECF subfamily)